MGESEVKRPKTRLPNGKINPEYQRWYRTTEKGKAANARYNESKRTGSARKKQERRDARGGEPLRKHHDPKVAKKRDELRKKKDRMFLIKGLIMERKSRKNG